MTLQAETLQTETTETNGRFFEVVHESTQIKRQIQFFMWLQGDLQTLLPHDVLIAAYGDLSSRDFRYDVVSPVRELVTGFSHADIEDLLSGLFMRWRNHGRSAYSLETESGVILNSACQCNLHRTLRDMRFVLVQGMRDERVGHDLLYVLFRRRDAFDDDTRRMFEILLPHIEFAARRVAVAPIGTDMRPKAALGHDSLSEHTGLTEREAEILKWVGSGKTNYEIGMILSISPFTVKNHLQRIFRKIDVSNRAQAVHKFEEMARRPQYQ